MKGPKARGYAVIDHTNSPGTISVSGGELLEASTATCTHCNRIVVFRPDRERPRNYCRSCDAYICDDCAYAMYVSGEHKTLEQIMDEMLDRIEHHGQVDR